LRLYTIFPLERGFPGLPGKLPCDNFKTTTGPGTHARSGMVVATKTERARNVAEAHRVLALMHNGVWGNGLIIDESREAIRNSRDVMLFGDGRKSLEML
jgi:hypothetical protein